MSEGPLANALSDDSITGSKRLITVAVMLASLMAFIDISIVNVALSDIRASFGTPINQISWVATSYMMANIVVIPLSGWFQRRFGFRHYFAGSILLFTVASVLCGIAWDLPSLIAFRALQGVGGGAIIPTAQAILFLRYPKHQHGTAASLVGLGGVMGPLLGPYLGGKLIDVAHWHSIFLINLPLGALAAVLAWRHVREPQFRSVRLKIDRVGMALLAVGLVSLQYVLEEGNRHGWFESLTITVLAVIALIALVTLVVHELEVRNPVLNLSLFANRSYCAATTINLLVGVAVFSGSFVLSLYCGSVLSYPALEIGTLLLQGNIVLLILMPLMGRVSEKLDARLLIGFGIVIMSLSLWLNAHLTSQADWHALLMPLLLRAVSISVIFVPLMPYALSDVPASERGNASSLFNLTRELGGSIGIAWMTTALDNHAKAHVADITSHMDVFSAVTQTEMAQLEALFHGLLADPSTAAVAAIKYRISLQALSLAFNDSFISLAIIFLVAVALVPLLRRPNSSAS